MNILMTTCGGFIREIRGWPEYNLARHLILRGHKVTGLTSTSVMKKMGAKRNEIISGVIVRRFNPILPTSLLWMLQHEFDIIHAHFPGYIAPISSYAALLKFLKKRKKIPLVHTIHGIYHDPFLVDDVEDPFSKPIKYNNIQCKFSLNPIKAINWFVHLPIFNADKLIALTKFEKEELQKYGIPRDKIEVVPNGIDLSMFSPLPPKDKFKKKFKIKGRLILFVGQLRRRKGPEYLIMSMPKILEEYPDTSLVFIGYKRNKKIEYIVKENNLENHIRFLGFLSERDKIAAYRSADVFCLPTNYEGFGIVYLEAMACGTPIVTTDTPGVMEIVIPKRNGLLVPPKDPNELARAIIKLFDSPSLSKKISKNNISDVKKYDWKIIAEKIESIYYKLL